MSDTVDQESTIRERITGIASKYLSADEVAAGMDDVLSIDSLNLMDIIIDIERSFQTRFTIDEVLSIETFHDLISIVIRRTTTGSV